MFASYTAGELVEVILQEAMLREKALDLWVAIVSDEGVLVFITEQGFSDTPAAFKMQVPVEEASHSVLNFTVPQGLTGRYTVLAAFNQQGAGIDDLSHSLRSNIVEISVAFILD